MLNQCLIGDHLWAKAAILSREGHKLQPGFTAPNDDNLSPKRPVSVMGHLLGPCAPKDAVVGAYLHHASVVGPLDTCNHGQTGFTAQMMAAHG